MLISVGKLLKLNDVFPLMFLQYLKAPLQFLVSYVKEKIVSLTSKGCLIMTTIAFPILARIYHRRGARRWKKVRRINGHHFVAKRFQMAYCQKCEDRIWGLGRQGYRCERCKITVHKRCCYFLTPEDVCKGFPVSEKYW